MTDRQPLFIEGLGCETAMLALQPGDIVDGMYYPDTLDERLTDLIENTLDEEQFIESIKNHLAIEASAKAKTEVLKQRQPTLDTKGKPMRRPEPRSAAAKPMLPSGIFVFISDEHREQLETLSQQYLLPVHDIAARILIRSVLNSED
jgi:hypothetical protein